MKNKVISRYESEKHCIAFLRVACILIIVATIMQFVLNAVHLGSAIKAKIAAQNTETISQHIKDEET